MKVTSLYFDLRDFDRYHRADWEGRLERWLMQPAEKSVVRATHPDDADYIIDVTSRYSLIGGRVFTPEANSHYARRPESTFVWDAGDHPTGLMPGIYCSLSRRLARSSRHRGFCYPLRMNPLVQPYPVDEAKFLYGFSGNITSPLRAKLFRTLEPEAKSGRALLRLTESIFHRIYDPASDLERNRYANDLRQSRFVLCPRGNGLASIRLFETMEAARVPVILSDAHHLPECVDWASCSIQVAERNLAAIPQILADAEPRWAELAQNARREWERCFGDETLLANLVAQLNAIREARRFRESTDRRLFIPRILPSYATVRAKQFVRFIQRKLP